MASNLGKFLEMDGVLVAAAKRAAVSYSIPVSISSLQGPRLSSNLAYLMKSSFK